MMEDLSRIFDRYQRRVLRQYSEPQGLYEPFGYSMDAGGKRLRPLLLLLVGKALGGRDDQLLPAALCVELFHNFTLMHDDIMDLSEIRRGRASVPAKFGQDTAILSGDAMLIQSFRFIAEAAKRSHADWFVIEQFNEMARKVCEGQQWDMDFEHRSDVVLEEYIEMIGKKTAVLFAFCLQCGGMLTLKDNSISMKLYRIGMQVGVAFQIQDDYLDYFAEEALLGKRKGGDILRGKKTALVLSVLDRANSEDKKLMLDILNDAEIGDKTKIKLAGDLFAKYDIKDVIQKYKDDFWQNGMDELDDLISLYPKLVVLQKFLKRLIEREA